MDAIHNQEVPGAVLLVWHNGHVIYRKAFGSRSLEPRREPMTLDTIFDLASLTKVIATNTAVMQLVERGKVRVNEPVAKYLPEFAANGKEDISIRDLLTHYSGLPPDLDLTTRNGAAKTPHIRWRLPKSLCSRQGRNSFTATSISLSSARWWKKCPDNLCRNTQRRIFFVRCTWRTRSSCPHQSWLPKIAPTQFDEQNKMLRGIVHDPTARRMGGVAGHAGVFSTADDLSKFALALLQGSSILSPLMVEKMTTPEQPPTLRRFARIWLGH